MPPAALTSSNRILTALDDDTPYVAAGPDRSVCIPSTISVLVTPRVSAAAAARASAPSSSTLVPSTFFMVVSFRGWRRLGVRVHAVDQVLVLHVHERAP